MNYKISAFGERLLDSSEDVKKLAPELISTLLLVKKSTSGESQIASQSSILSELKELGFLVTSETLGKTAVDDAMINQSKITLIKKNLVTLLKRDFDKEEQLWGSYLIAA